jgi:hypothetical protein
MLPPLIADTFIGLLKGEILTSSQIPLILSFVILSEAGVLYFLNYCPFFRSLLVSAVMNVTSTLFGVVLALLFPYNSNFINSRGEVYSADGIITLFYLVLAYLLSIIIEGRVMILLKPDIGKPLWLVCWSANTVSYLLVVLPLLLLLWSWKNP